jgi:hypothetical protein
VNSAISPRRARGVQPFDVARLADRQRRVDEDFDELAWCEAAAHTVTVGAAGRDQRDDGRDTRVDEHSRDLASASNVLGPIGRREPEVLTQAVAEHVAVEHARGSSACRERRVQCASQRRLAGA